MSTNDNMTKGRLVEQIAAMLHEGPDVTVERNVRVPSLQGQGLREIDVLISRNVAGYLVRLAIECKNEKDPIGVERIDAFIGKLEDVGIPSQHGIYISTGGYTDGAMRRARAKGIHQHILTGLTEDRLASSVHAAFQSLIYLLLDVRTLSITTMSQAQEEMLQLYNSQQEFSGYVLDLIWEAWIQGKMPVLLGEHNIRLSISEGWYRPLDDSLEPVSSIELVVHIRGLIVGVSGEVMDHILIDPESNTINRRQVRASFTPPASGSSDVPVINTEAELVEWFATRPEYLHVALGRFPLPRIRWGGLYWPPSKRVAERLLDINRAMAAGEMDPTALRSMSLEDERINTIWEPIWMEHPYLAKRSVHVDIQLVSDEGIITDPQSLLLSSLEKARQANDLPTVGVLLQQLGSQAYTANQPEQAIDFYEQALEIVRPSGEPVQLLTLLKVLGTIYNTDTMYPRAVELFQEGLTIARQVGDRNNEGELLRRIADAFSSLDQREQAISYYQEALQIARALDKSFAAASILTNLANAVSAEGQIEQALDLYTESLHLALLLDKEQAQDLLATTLLNRGLNYNQLGRYKEAVRDLTFSLKYRPQSADTYVLRALTYFSMERYDEAITDYTRSLDLQPDEPFTWIHRGLTYAYKGLYEQAVSDYIQGLELSPDDPHALTNRGIAHSNMGRYDESLADFNRSLELRPDDPEALTARANTYSALKRDEEALADYSRSLTLRPDDAITLYNRGNLYLGVDRYEEAVADFTRSLALRPNHGPTLANRGLALEQLNRNDEALADYTCSISAELPNHAPITHLTMYDFAGRPNDHRVTDPSIPIESLYKFVSYTNRGRLYQKMGLYPEAVNDFTAALTLYPNQSLPLGNRGYAHQLMRHYSEAVEDYTAALEIDPTDSQVLYNLACVYSLQNKVDLALSTLVQAIEGNEQYRQKAQTDADFNNLQENPVFKQLVGA